MRTNAGLCRPLQCDALGLISDLKSAAVSLPRVAQYRISSVYFAGSLTNADSARRDSLTLEGLATSLTYVLAMCASVLWTTRACSRTTAEPPLPDSATSLAKAFARRILSESEGSV